MNDHDISKSIRYLIICIISVVCLGSAIFVVVALGEYRSIKQSNEHIEDIAYGGDVTDKPKSKIITHNGFVGEAPTESSSSIIEVSKSPYSNYSVVEVDAVDLPTIDFDSLNSINEDLIVWLYIPDIDLSYPVVSSDDNQDYLNINFEKNKSIAGTLFTDCRCSTPFYQKTIIYGHNMKNGTMFNKLYDLEDLIADSPSIYVMFPNGSFMEYTIESTAYTVNTDSIYDINSVDDTDTLVLSTCVKKEKRFIVIAKRSSSL